MWTCICGEPTREGRKEKAGEQRTIATRYAEGNGQDEGVLHMREA
jgi:hypothetical protein